MGNKLMKTAVYSFSHFLMDFLCHYYAFSLIGARFPEYTFEVFLCYNFVAFALQCPIGALCDRFKARYSATASFVLLLVGYLLGFVLFRGKLVGSVAGLVICAFANAGLHAGGCIAVMEPGERGLKNGGIFIAFGALGVSLGDYLANNGISIFPWAVIAVVSMIVLINLLRYEEKKPVENCVQAAGEKRDEAVVLVLCLIAVFVRSYGGFILPSGFKGLLDPVRDTSSFSFASAVLPGMLGFIGKCLGGFMVIWSVKLFRSRNGLRFANYRYGAAALIIATVLFAFFGGNPVLSALGIILFHSVMPVTLFEIYCIFPGNPGFSLGLTTLLLFAGCLPTYVFFPGDGMKRVILAVLTLIGAACLAAAGKVARKGNICTT